MTGWDILTALLTCAIFAMLFTRPFNLEGFCAPTVRGLDQKGVSLYACF